MTEAPLPENNAQATAEAPQSAQLQRWFGPISLQADGALPEWIPLHRLCNRVHPIYGAIVMTEAKMDQAIANFTARVLRPDSPVNLQIPVDTRHAGDAACGWIAEMRKELPYLMGRPEWTEHGKKVVLDRQFLYVSPVYEDDPERGPIFKEATLTNRDFLRMPPIILDEGVPDDFPSPFVADHTPDSHTSSQSVRRSTMSETVTQEKQAAANAPVTPELVSPDGTPEMKALEEMSVTLKSLSEVVEQQKQQLEAQAALLQVAEGDAKQAEIMRLTEASVARGVDAYTVNSLRSILLALPRKANDVTVSLEVEGKAQAFPNLYSALCHFLEHVPAQVPVGQENTKNDHQDPSLEEKVDMAHVRHLIELAQAQVKEA